MSALQVLKDAAEKQQREQKELAAQQKNQQGLKEAHVQQAQQRQPNYQSPPQQPQYPQMGLTMFAQPGYSPTVFYTPHHMVPAGMPIPYGYIPYVSPVQLHPFGVTPMPFAMPGQALQGNKMIGVATAGNQNQVSNHNNAPQDHKPSQPAHSTTEADSSFNPNTQRIKRAKIKLLSHHGNSKCVFTPRKGTEPFFTPFEVRHMILAFHTSLRSSTQVHTGAGATMAFVAN